MSRSYFIQFRHVLALVWLGLLLGFSGPKVQAETPRQVFQQETDTLFQQGTTQAFELNFEAAIASFEAALARYRLLGDSVKEAQTLAGLGFIADFQGHYQTSLDYFQRSFALLARARAASGTLDPSELGNGLDLEVLIQQRLNLARLTGDRLGEASGLFLQGAVQLGFGQYGAAIADFEQSLALLNTTPFPRLEQQLLGSLGLAYYFQQRPAEAIPYFEAHLAAALQADDRWGQGVALNNLALAFDQQGQSEAGIEKLFEAIAIWEDLRQAVGDLEKIERADIQRAAYNNLQRLLIEQGQIEPALEVAERSRAQAFIDLLNTRQEPASAPGSHDSGGAEPITIAEIKAFAQAQQLTLVEYSLVYDDNYKPFLYIWVVQPEGSVFFRQVDLQSSELTRLLTNLGLDNVIQAARCFGNQDCVRRVRSRGRQPVFADRSLSGQRTAAPKPASVSSAASPSNIYLQGLYQILIEPIADLLPTETDARLAVIPQDSLFLVPFAALQDDQNRYLVEDYAIHTAPSIQSLRLTAERQQQLTALASQQKPTALVVGNPEMPSVTPILGGSPQRLSPLPFAEREAVAIAQLLGVKPLVGQGAQKSVVLEQLPHANLIHLATHGNAKNQKGQALQSWIALAPDTSDASSNSGLLTAEEVLELDLKAQLVVLSACETGEGRITGDGVVGLSRAWLSAGAGRVLVSLWPVADQSTSILMQAFYENLEKNLEPDEALRQAMLGLLKGAYSEPYDWAAFTLVGSR